MEAITLKCLSAAVNGKILSGKMDTLVKSISVDSRSIKKGQMFFALKGSKFDGHNFIKDAVNNGAAGIVFSDTIDLSTFKQGFSFVKVSDTLTALGGLSKTYRNKFQNIQLIALTGSNGKTTTKEMIYSILKCRAKTACNKGNLNNRIGLPLSLLDLDSSDRYGVFEIGTSVFGEIKTLTKIVNPQAAVITNIGYSHLETFKTLRGVYEEKVELFNNVSDDCTIIVNLDDPYLRDLTKYSNKKIITFSLTNNLADVFADNILFENGKMSFEVFIHNNKFSVKLPAKGRMNISNALAASAAAWSFDFSFLEIKRGLENFCPPDMRMQAETNSDKSVFVNDAYNANPSSMKESIQTVYTAYADKEITLVLGDMLELGEEADKYHKELGQFVDKQNVKSVYLVGKKMKNAKEVLGDKAFYAENPKDLIDEIKKESFNEKSVVLFKGSRGMKLEEIYKSLKK
ncbi:MAG: UDP-N-acetylmuramoyl-tripeptide--D-alanyl-D-alanine ligase [Elusimicrobiota bacterium]|jgi:UDP-N-acetylmuramoyl-tripeptide--D-alanyl-D-alanine ligase|nr:UDP-N-acetylmuramoyl-tripeptide--D-alanyl-D-alanine ligase [Elusimicrobiota bacterium]